MLSSKFKVLAVMAATLVLAVVIAAPSAMADQASAPGQLKLDPNGNQGTPPGQDGNSHSRRNDKCKGRGCGTEDNTIVENQVDVLESDGIDFDCTIPEFKNDPRCVVPVTKKAKRKVVSVKLSNSDNIEPAAVDTAPAPVVAAVPAPVAPAPVAPAPVVKVKTTSSTVQDYNLGTTNFQ